VRYRTGDRVRLARTPCPCGRTFGRLEGGILGRLDDMLIVRGVNVFPSSIEAVVRRFPVDEFQIAVFRDGELDEVRVLVEVARAEPERLERFVDSVERVRRSQLRDGRAAAEAMRAQRAELDALVERAEELLKGAGFRASPDTTREISNTLLGAAVDPHRAKD